MDKPFNVYILYSNKINRYYVGISSNLKWRLQQHNRGLSPYTRGKGPWELIYSKEFPSRAAARAREKEIKSWKSPNSMEIKLGFNRQSGPGTSTD
jgi:putative endonuclease